MQRSLVGISHDWLARLTLESFEPVTIDSFLKLQDLWELNPVRGKCMFLDVPDAEPRIAQPDQDLVCFSIYLTHHLHLSSLFDGVGLIDAQLINPIKVAFGSFGPIASFEGLNTTSRNRYSCPTPVYVMVPYSRAPGVGDRSVALRNNVKIRFTRDVDMLDVAEKATIP